MQRVPLSVSWTSSGDSNDYQTVLPASRITLLASCGGCPLLPNTWARGMLKPKCEAGTLVRVVLADDHSGCRRRNGRGAPSQLPSVGSRLHGTQSEKICLRAQPPALAACAVVSMHFVLPNRLQISWRDGAASPALSTRFFASPMQCTESRDYATFDTFWAFEKPASLRP